MLRISINCAACVPWAGRGSYVGLRGTYDYIECAGGETERADSMRVLINDWPTNSEAAKNESPRLPS